MVEDIFSINWLATIVGFIAAFILGSLWFSPLLFGKKWAEGCKVELVEGAKMPMVPMVAQALGTFMMAWFVGITASIEHLLTVIIALVAFALLKFASGHFSQKTNYATNVESLYILAMGALMIIAHGIF